jgi:hypothetical protein
MQVNKWFNQETGLAPIDPKALERVKVPQPSFKNVFITGTVSKVIGPDCFELAAISISPHAGNGARLLSGRTLLVQSDTVSDLAGLKPGVALSLAADISYRDSDTIVTVARKVFWIGRPLVTPVAASP